MDLDGGNSPIPQGVHLNPVRMNLVQDSSRRVGDLDEPIRMSRRVWEVWRTRVKDLRGWDLVAFLLGLATLITLSALVWGSGMAVSHKLLESAGILILLTSVVTVIRVAIRFNNRI